MSDFPDLSDFASPAPSDTSNRVNPDSADPTADFLARERALLGDDAAFVTGGGPSPTVSALGLGHSGTDSPAFSSSMNVLEIEADLGLDVPPASKSATSKVDPDEDMDKFQRDFPALDDASLAATTTSNNLVTQYTATTTTTTTIGGNSPSLPPFGSSRQEESEFIREWRERQAATIAERESRAADEKAKRAEQARKAIDRFYEDYNSKREKAISENRAKQEEASYSFEGANVWERACRMADLAGPGGTGEQKKLIPKTARDTSRMRKLLLDLRKDPKAPGVAVP